MNKMIIIKMMVIIFLASLSLQKVDGQGFLKKLKDAANKEINKVTYPKPTQNTPKTAANDNVSNNKAETGNNRTTPTNVSNASPLMDEVPKGIHLITDSSGFDYNSAEPMILNDRLLFVHQSQVKDNGNQFADFNGTSLKIINIPDSLYGHPKNSPGGLSLKPVAYKNNIYIPTLNHKILKYNGTTLTPIVSDNAEDGFLNPFLFRDNLYLEISYGNGFQLAHYDGTTISNLGIWGVPMLQETGFPILFNNNLYFDGLTKFDGQKLISFNDIIWKTSSSQILPQVFYPFVYKKVLYFGCMFQIFNGMQHYAEELAAFDGEKIKIVANPDKLKFDTKFPIAFNDKLYLGSGLLEFDGTKITLIRDTNGIYGTAIVYKKKLYFQQDNKLMQYDGVNLNSITVIGYFTNPVEYNGKLYFLDGGDLDYYNGTEVKKVIYIEGGSFYPPIVYKNKLFFIYKKQLAYLDEGN